MTVAIVCLSVLCLLFLILWLRANSAMTNVRIENAALKAKNDDEHFKNIANEMLDGATSKLRLESGRQLEEILSPLRANIESFNRTIDEKYSREASERHTLGVKIDELRRLNDLIGREAGELAKALRGNNRIQGEWGEMILESLLEKAGFVEGREFVVQQTTDGLRPDVVIYMPGENCVVVDSKVSLTAYVNWANADSCHDRQTAGKAHVASVRAHVQELSRKNYQDYIGQNRLDFAMMFIPNEAAYLAAMQIEPELWQEAFNKRVLIISPTHLLSVLKLIQQLWRHESRERNAVAIADEAGKMYDKFASFVEDLQKIERAVNQASAVCEQAYTKLSSGTGNLLRRAEKLREMGAKATKNLPKTE